MTKILFISSHLPYPPLGGSRVRTNQAIEALKELDDLDLLCITDEYEKDRKNLEEYEDEINGIFDKIKFYPQSKTVSYLNSFIWLFKKEPLQVGYYWNRKAKKWLDKNYKKYDLIFNSLVRTTEYSKDLPTKKAVDLVDAISLNYKRAKKYSSFPWSILYSIDEKRLKNYEVEITDKFDKCFITSGKDKEEISQNGGRKEKIDVVSNHIEPPDKREHEEREWIMFLGAMHYQPNVDAVTYFAEEIFPKIREEISNAKFKIVGMDPAEEVKNLEKIDGVEVTGFVEDPYEYMAKSKVFVAPMRSGAGVQNKVLEALAYGKATVVTEEGAEGLKAEDRKDIVIVENEKELVEEITNLMENKERRERLEENSRKFIEKYHSKEEIMKEYREEIRKILEK